MSSEMNLSTKQIVSQGVGKELVSLGLEDLRAGLNALRNDEALETVREAKDSFVKAAMLIERGYTKLIDVVGIESVRPIVSVKSDGIPISKREAVIRALLMHEKGGVSQHFLAQCAGLSDSTFFKIVQKLRSEGLVIGSRETLRPSPELITSRIDGSEASPVN
jgi:biotin operon repressor